MPTFLARWLRVPILRPPTSLAPTWKGARAMPCKHLWLATRPSTHSANFVDVSLEGAILVRVLRVCVPGVCVAAYNDD